MVTSKHMFFALHGGVGNEKTWSWEGENLEAAGNGKNENVGPLSPWCRHPAGGPEGWGGFWGFAWARGLGVQGLGFRHL